MHINIVGNNINCTQIMNFFLKKNFIFIVFNFYVFTFFYFIFLNKLFSKNNDDINIRLPNSKLFIII